MIRTPAHTMTLWYAYICTTNPNKIILGIYISTTVFVVHGTYGTVLVFYGMYDTVPRNRGTFYRGNDLKILLYRGTVLEFLCVQNYG